MNARELDQAMLDYQVAAEALAVLGDKIMAAVMELKLTHKIGSLTASYSGGRKTYNYAAAWSTWGSESGVNIADYTKTEFDPIVDYNAACKAAGIKQDDVPSVKSKPSVSLKMS